MNTLRVLGIDPGVGRVGWGVLTKTVGHLHADAFGRIDTDKSLPLAKRLACIATELTALLRRHKPNIVAVEKLFFAKNVKTAMDVGHARGVILLIAAQQKKSVIEYTPMQVKQALTGYGNAEKRQVQHMVQSLLHIRLPASHDDTADALAIAYTALVHTKS